MLKNWKALEFSLTNALKSSFQIPCVNIENFVEIALVVLELCNIRQVDNDIWWIIVKDMENKLLLNIKLN